jgi:tetratricopeptide (TPR) repeat protein
LDDPSFKKDGRLKYMPPGIRSYWERSFEPGADPGNLPVTRDDFVFYQKEFTKQLEIVGLMQKSGVGILAGTDALNPFCFPGFSLHDELALLVQAGLTPSEALQTATINPARFLGEENDFGAVEKGRIADLVLLDANPLEDIANTKKIQAVVFNGRYFPKPRLEEMLAKLEALAAKKSIADALFTLVIDKGFDAALNRYYELKRTGPEDYDFGVGELDDLGFRLLGRKKADEAIRILELNAEVYPLDWYVYDSLGEGYMRIGNRERAIKNYRRSLELNSRNTNATDKLMQLGAR